MSDNPIRPLTDDSKAEREWRGGRYLCTAANSLEANIFESKLRGENIPCLKRHRGAGDFMEIFMGTASAFPIDIYVPAETLEDAANILIAIPFEDCEPVDFDSMSDEELDELVGAGEDEDYEDE